MDGNLDEKGTLMARIHQLERERDALQKDVEQLCMQQSGPSIIGVATRMHFQRTATLEQEIENLKVKLAACTRENINLQEELAEAYRVKTQLADLHAAEVTKNLEAEKQVKFFQGSVAAAFSERDNSIMQAEKAKENEEVMSQKLKEIEKRLKDLTFEFLKQKELNETLQVDLVKLEDQTRYYGKVINKFYEIRENCLEESEELSLDDKCARLLHAPEEIWSVNDPSTSEYITALEKELEKIKGTLDSLQNKLRMGLEIENHLKKKVRELQKNNILSAQLLMSSIEDLRHYYLEQRVHIMNLLTEEGFYFKSISETLEEKFREFDLARIQQTETPQHDAKPDEYECRDVHTTTFVENNLLPMGCSLEAEKPELPDDVAEKMGEASGAFSSQLTDKNEERGLLDNMLGEKDDVSEALAQALQEKDEKPGCPANVDEKKGNQEFAQAMQEKVSALLLLSQQEERHLLERNVNAALQKKIEELQRNLMQVTNEKVKVLMELARLKQEYQSFREKLADSGDPGKSQKSEKGLVIHEREGRLKNLLNKSYLKRWIGPLDSSAEGGAQLGSQTDLMKIDYATLKESIESMVHLTTSVRRLRLALSKVKETIESETTATRLLEAIGYVITEANLLKTALGISIPISWSAEADLEPAIFGESGHDHIASVSAAGFEMVELVILAADILKGDAEKSGLAH